MVKITPIASDLGRQSLRSDNEADTVTKAVSAVSATRGIHKLSKSQSFQENTRLQRRRKERRTQERRVKNTHVMLDTRSHQERRKKQRRNSNDKNRKKPFHQGIDIKV